jgi:hypothetical protein
LQSTAANFFRCGWPSDRNFRMADNPGPMR